MRDLFIKLSIIITVALMSCRNPGDGAVSVNWKEGKAIAVNIPAAVTGELAADSVALLVHVVVNGNTTKDAVIGDFAPGNGLVFTPVLAFSPGIQYDIIVRGQRKASFTIPAVKSAFPEVVAVYPGNDTVPVNLLKIYVRFSQPMQEGRSAAFLRLVRNDGDTLQNALLDLQPELWNEERTTLTIWLDPGRIKRGLQPNLRLGAPLTDGEKYSFVVIKGWKDRNGEATQRNYVHSFVTAGRDSISPSVDDWQVTDTIVGDKRSVAISCFETLDHFLLMDCLWVVDEKGNRITGNIAPFEKNNGCVFVPEKSLPKGNYQLVVASRLEDLAGNNMNRPFERDILHSPKPSAAAYLRKPFVLR